MQLFGRLEAETTKKSSIDCAHNGNYVADLLLLCVPASIINLQYRT